MIFQLEYKIKNKHSISTYSSFQFTLYLSDLCVVSIPSPRSPLCLLSIYLYIQFFVVLLIPFRSVQCLYLVLVVHLIPFRSVQCLYIVLVVHLIPFRSVQCLYIVLVVLCVCCLHISTYSSLQFTLYLSDLCSVYTQSSQSFVSVVYISLHIALCSPPYTLKICIVSIPSPRSPLCLLSTYLYIQLFLVHLIP